MKKLLLSALLCILSIAANVDAAHALNPYTIIRDAKNGQASSQFLLGLLYTTGAESEVIEVDPHKAREWYEKAALQGSAFFLQRQFFGHEGKLHQRLHPG